MAKETILTYDLSEAPKYIMWERPNRRTIYYEPVIRKKENELDPDAYVAMYARCYYSKGSVTRYRMDEYLFQVVGPTLAEALQLFGERLQQLQADGVIEGRYLNYEKIETKHHALLHENVYRKLKNEFYKLAK